MTQSTSLARSMAAIIAVLSTSASADTQAPPPRDNSRSASRLSDTELWPLLDRSGGMAVIGLKMAGSNRGVWKQNILVTRAEMAESVERLRALPSIRVASVDDVLPIVTVQLGGQSALAATRQMPFIDYIEPLFTEISLQSGSLSGCSEVQWDFASNPVATASPYGDYLPWNYIDQKIDMAWRRSAGANVTLGISDTGISAAQPQLHAEFTSGSSYGRVLTEINASSSTVIGDECGHGTRMAAIIGAPFDRTGTIVGVAYRSSLVTAKHSNGVLAGGNFILDNVEHIRISLRDLADAGARIVSMAWGSTEDLQSIADEISYLYSSRDMLFVGAAGTYPPADACGVQPIPGTCLFYCDAVVFPARMPEVIAVTGAIRGYPDDVHPTACYGPEVDVAAYIGDFPTLGENQWEIVSLGGSSGATAITTGILGLIASRYPFDNRDQIRERLFRAAHRWSMFKHYQVGWGVVNAYAAVGGFTGLDIVGPSSVAQGAAFTLNAQTIGDGPFVFRWNTGQTTGSISATSGSAGTCKSYSVTVTDTAENVTKSDSHNVCSCSPNPEPCGFNECGSAPDGCGGSVSCGTCMAGTYCKAGICL